MKIGCLAVDSKTFPNIALMRLASYHRAKGDSVERAFPMFGKYDRLYASKIFTFSPDFNPYEYRADEVIKGGTGYDIYSRLPDDIENHLGLAYDLYPNCDFSVQFYSRGCIRKCPFCLVSDKEGYIHPVEPMEWNPQAKWIEVLDNNFFANPEWKSAVKDLRSQDLPVKLHGVDVRIMNEEQAVALKSLKLKTGVHIAWDDANVDIVANIKLLLKFFHPDDIICYVLVGYNSTREQDLWRLRTLKELGVLPFVMPFRDYDNKREPLQYEKDLARWANRRWLFMSMDFTDYSPRKGFRCGDYFNNIK